MELVHGKMVHGARVVEGRTYCTDCGAHLRVGSYQAMRHGGDHGRNVCPDMDTEQGLDAFARNRDGDGGPGYGN